MSGALPTTRLPSNVTITSWSPTLISRAQSLKTQRRRRGAGVQRWMLRYTYSVLTAAEHRELDAFISAQRGQFDTFTAVLPSGISPGGALGGTPLVNGALAVGVSAAAIDGLTINISGWGKLGDFFKFGAHSKVYRLTADANSNGSGQATLNFMPALLASVADNEAVSFSSVPFTVILGSDQSSVSLEPPVLGSLAFDAVEDY